MPQSNSTTDDPPELQLKVGDKLAFRYGYKNRIAIHAIEKITPSGRIVCGQYTLNPDLTIRGDRGYSGPYRGELVTPEIWAQHVRQRHITVLTSTIWKDLPDTALESIVKIIKESK